VVQRAFFDVLFDVSISVLFGRTDVA